MLQLLGRRRLIELRRAGYNTELSAPLDNIPFSTSTERERIEENVCYPYNFDLLKVRISLLYKINNCANYMLRYSGIN